ncbi:MAG TPA: hypothetical protein VIZ58_12175, partial [Thermoanaerobaculia bacterium]
MTLTSRFLGRVGLALLAATAVVSAASGEESNRDGHFGAKDVKRSYGYSCLGAVNDVHFAQIGQVSCDGKDTCTGNGTITTAGGPLLTYVTGKYTVEPNGIGLVTYYISLTPGGATFPDPLPIRFVLIDGGREIRGFPL